MKWSMGWPHRLHTHKPRPIYILHFIKALSFKIQDETARILTQRRRLTVISQFSATSLCSLPLSFLLASLLGLPRKLSNLFSLSLNCRVLSPFPHPTPPEPKHQWRVDLCIHITHQIYLPLDFPVNLINYLREFAVICQVFFSLLPHYLYANIVLLF